MSRLFNIILRRLRYFILIFYYQLTLLHFVEDVLEDRHSVSRFLSPIVLSDIGGMAVYLSKYIVGALATFAGSISNFADLCSLPPATLGSLDTHIDSPSGPPELQDLLRAFKVVYLSPPSRVGELDPVNRKACADFVQKWEEFVHSKDELILIFAVIASCVSFCGNQECGFPIAKVKAAQSSLVCTGIVAAIVCCLPHRIELLSKDDSANVNKNNALLNDSKRQIARESLRCLANILYSCVDAQVIVI